MEDISNKTKPEKINQKEPMSNIVPNQDTSEFPEKRVERKKTKTIPKAEVNSQDLGKTIFPSENLAKAQKIMLKASPITKSKPLEVSTGMLVKGKQNSGNNITTKKSDQNESFSNIFVLINFILP